MEKNHESLIQLNLGERVLTVKAHDEKQASWFRQAEQKINQKMEHYKKKYDFRDEPTFYLMVCLDFVTDLITVENELKFYRSHFEQLSSELEQALALNLHQEDLCPTFVDEQNSE